MRQYTYAELEPLPTLCVGQASSLKIETATERVWLSRMTEADGAIYSHAVEVERLTDGRWVTVAEYPSHPRDGGSWPYSAQPDCRVRWSHHYGTVCESCGGMA
jgi:hypothetical protein